MPEIPIDRKAFPHLRTAVGGTPIQWDFGSMYAIHLTASLIRIDADQIQWYKHGRFHASGLWTPLRCLPARNAFCSIVQDEPEASVLVFPSGVVDMPVDITKLLLPSDFRRFFDGLGGLACKTKNSNRMLSYTDNRYEMSMCDLVDGHLEVVLTPDTNILYIRQHREVVGFLTLLSLLSLYLFVHTCEHVIALCHGKRMPLDHGSVTVPFIIALTVVMRLLMAESVLIIAEEVTLQVILSLYVLVHASIRLCLHTNKRKVEDKLDFSDPQGGTVIGMLIAAQVLLSLELNNTIDSPFLGLYVSLFGIRNFLKFLNLVLLHYKRVDKSTKKRVADDPTLLKKTCELLSDVFVFGALVVIGIQVSANSTEEYMSTAGTVLLISVLGGTLAHSITSLHVE
jgi:hypothetical protein